MSAHKTPLSLEDRLAAAEASTNAMVPHEVALAIMGGGSPVRAYRDQRGLTLRERSGGAASYLSETEHGRKPGSVAALTRLAEGLGVSVDALVSV